MITCSIHSTEVASTSTAIEFAYKLLTEDNPKFHAILQNTIFILVPSLNPDGLDIVTRVVSQDPGHPFEGHVRRSCIRSMSAMITIATGTSFRRQRRAWP